MRPPLQVITIGGTVPDHRTELARHLAWNLSPGAGVNSPLREDWGFAGEPRPLDKRFPMLRARQFLSYGGYRIAVIHNQDHCAFTSVHLPTMQLHRWVTTDATHAEPAPHLLIIEGGPQVINIPILHALHDRAGYHMVSVWIHPDGADHQYTQQESQLTAVSVQRYGIRAIPITDPHTPNAETISTLIRSLQL